MGGNVTTTSGTVNVVGGTVVEPTCSLRGAGSLVVVVVGATTTGCVVVVEVEVEEVLVNGGGDGFGCVLVVVETGVEVVGDVVSGTSG